MRLIQCCRCGSQREEKDEAEQIMYQIKVIYRRNVVHTLLDKDLCPKCCEDLRSFMSLHAESQEDLIGFAKSEPGASEEYTL